MPTVIAVDASASLLRRVDSDTTRQDIVQRGVLHFLQLLQRDHPLELISLVTFSSTPRLHLPFTRDHTKLRTALYDIELRDSTDTAASVRLASDLLASNFPSYPTAACQIVLVVDASPSSLWTGINDGFEPPFATHIVALGSESDFHTPSSLLPKTCHGECIHVVLPGQKRVFKHSFDQLIKARYGNFRGLFTTGHLTTNVQLHPDPCLGGSSSSQIIFPPMLAIRGFISLAEVPVIPAMKRYTLHEAPPNQLTPDTSRALLPLMRAALASERSAAVIPLKSNNTALVVCTPDDTGLELLLLPSAALGDGLDRVSLAAHHGTAGSTTLIQQAHSPLHQSSEFACTRTSLTTDLPKIARLLRSLPSKKESLYKEVERLRMIANMFAIPSIMDELTKLLQVSKREATGQAAMLMADLETQCATHPSRPIVLPSGREAHADVKNLLN